MDGVGAGGGDAFEAADKGAAGGVAAAFPLGAVTLDGGAAGTGDFLVGIPFESRGIGGSYGPIYTGGSPGTGAAGMS